MAQKIQILFYENEKKLKLNLFMQKSYSQGFYLEIDLLAVKEVSSREEARSAQNKLLAVVVLLVAHLLSFECTFI